MDKHTGLRNDGQPSVRPKKGQKKNKAKCPACKRVVSVILPAGSREGDPEVFQRHSVTPNGMVMPCKNSREEVSIHDYVTRR